MNSSPNILPQFHQLERYAIQLCRKGSLIKLHEAEELFTRMITANRKPSIFAFNTLMIAASRMNFYPTVISFYNRMHQANDLVFDLHTFGVFIDSCCRINQVGLAFSAFGTLLKQGFIANTVIFNSLVNGLCFAARTGDAAMVLDRMPQMGCTPNVISYNTLIKALCFEGRTNEATVVLDKMPEMGCTPDVFSYNTLIKGLCSTKNTGRALELHHRMVSGECSCRPDVFTYSTTINALCKEGSMDKVDRLLAKMTNEGVVPNVITYNCIIHRYTLSRQWKEAIKIFRKMVGKGLSPDVVTFNTDGWIHSDRTSLSSRKYF